MARAVGLMLAVVLSLAAGRGDQSQAKAQLQASDHGRVVLMHSDGTYESAYAWTSDGCPPPDFGSFAERYESCQLITAIVLDVFGAPWGELGYVDAYVWSDEGGIPGEVLAVERNVVIDELAQWPYYRRNYIYLQQPIIVDGNWWIGFWPIMILYEPDIYIAADLNGSGGGSPMTKIAPGLEWPEGWQDVAVRFLPTAALGIGAEVEETPSPVISSTWGEIKDLFQSARR